MNSKSYQVSNCSKVASKNKEPSKFNIPNELSAKELLTCKKNTLRKYAITNTTAKIHLGKI